MGEEFVPAAEPDPSELEAEMPPPPSTMTLDMNAPAIEPISPVEGVDPQPIQPITPITGPIDVPEPANPETVPVELATTPPGPAPPAD